MTTKSSTKLTEYLNLQLQRLQIDLKASRLFQGTTDTGNINEDAIRSFLQSLLPTKFAVGTGEVITPSGHSITDSTQSEQKDVIIYDPIGSAIFGWGGAGLHLFPIESVYCVLEVKTCLHKKSDLQKAMHQVAEVKRLHRTYCPDIPEPFTGIFAFESRISPDDLFETVRSTKISDRPDFVIEIGTNYYVSHWHYLHLGPGPIMFATAVDVYEEVKTGGEQRRFLTLGRSESSLLWFYLFLIDRLNILDRQPPPIRRPNLWQYTEAFRVNLGYIKNEHTQRIE
jgi:hypothetical protein